MRAERLVMRAGPAALAVLVACGSTVEPQEAHPTAGDRAAASVRHGPDTGIAEPATGTGAVEVEVEVDASGADSIRGNTPLAGTGATGDTRGAPTATASPTTSRGVTDNTITLGISVLADGAANGALVAAGAEEAAVGDGRAAAQAVIDHINARGGIAGRQIVAVYREWDTGQHWPTEYQRDCSAFTQDAEVFAVVSQVDQPGWDILAGCLANHGTPFLHTARMFVDDEMLGAWAPYVYEMSGLRTERWGAVVDALVARDFFGDDARVGIVYWDDPPTRRALSEVIEPALAAHGRPVAEKAGATPYNNTSEIGGTASEYQAAVLQFNSAGVTNVLFFGTWSTAPFFFMAAAENQGYRPRYALNSTELPNFIVDSVPRAQLSRALSIGWWPTVDVGGSQDPGDNPAQHECLEVIDAAGIDAPSRFAEHEFVRTCDGLLFLEAALAGANDATLSPTVLRAAVDGLGTRYGSPMTHATMFGPGRFDGVNAVRVLAFDDACGCFTYATGNQPAP